MKIQSNCILSSQHFTNIFFCNKCLSSVISYYACQMEVFSCYEFMFAYSVTSNKIWSPTTSSYASPCLHQPPLWFKQLIWHLVPTKSVDFWQPYLLYDFYNMPIQYMIVSKGAVFKWYYKGEWVLVDTRRRDKMTHVVIFNGNCKKKQKCQIW